MLEHDVIQVRGFRNIVENGEVTGFQVRVRSTYYRGVWLSLLRVGDVTVDKETFGKDLQVWEIGGIEYTPDQMLELGDIQWPNTDAAVVKIKKKGGLATGYHDVSVAYDYIMSYIPPFLDPDVTGNIEAYDKRMILV